MKTLKKLWSNWLVRFNMLMVAMWPFATDIAMALSSSLPVLKPYLPEDWFKTVGLIATVVNIVLGAIVTRQQAQK